MADGNGNRGSQLLEGSQTISVEELRPVLQLRAEQGTNTREEQSRPTRPSVRWQSDVIDNENMNKKKTKICCIFHPQQEFDVDEEECHSDHGRHSTSSSSSSSSSESESEKELDLTERRQRRVARRHRRLKENKGKSPNAYEIQPDYTEDRARREQRH